MRSGLTPPGTDRCFLPDAQGRCRFLDEKNLCTCLLYTSHPAGLPIEINEPLSPITIEEVTVETFGVDYPEPTHLSLIHI